MTERHSRAQRHARATNVSPPIAFASLVLASVSGCWTSHDPTASSCGASCETACCSVDFTTGVVVEPYCLAPRMTCRERPPAEDAGSPWWSSDALLTDRDAAPPSDPDAPTAADAGIDCSEAWSPARRCATPSDCTMVFHYADCCGTGAWVGMHVGAADGYRAYVEACEADAPLCGCAARPTIADDGTDETQMGAALHVACAAGVCTTSYGR